MKERIEKLQELLLNNKNVDAALITSNVNRYYFSGFSSSLGFLIVTKKESYLLVDFRYTEAAINKVNSCKVVKYNSNDDIVDILKQHNVKSVAIENFSISLHEANRLKSVFNSVNIETIEDESLDNAIFKLRMIKSKYEIEKIKESQQITDAAFSYILPKIQIGMTERDIALEIEFFMRKEGAEGVAFDLIVVSGKNTSLPHGVPGDKKIQAGDFITMDIGAKFCGYHSDMTRTIGVNNVNDEQKKIYDIVLKAQLEAINAIKPGKICLSIDKIARDIIADSGYKECFGHATGHSLGLDIHESPRFSIGCNEKLFAGMVMTVEPGIYINNKFGVRIEDMVLVTDDGFNNLTKSKKELIII